MHEFDYLLLQDVFYNYVFINDELSTYINFPISEDDYNRLIHKRRIAERKFLDTLYSIYSLPVSDDI